MMMVVVMHVATSRLTHKRAALGSDKAKSPGNLFEGRGFLNLIGRLPTLPHTRACSTIGAEGLNYRVRDGNGWDPLARITQNRIELWYWKSSETDFVLELKSDGH